MSLLLGFMVGFGTCLYMVYKYPDIVNKLADGLVAIKNKMNQP